MKGVERSGARADCVARREKVRGAERAIDRSDIIVKELERGMRMSCSAKLKGEEELMAGGYRRQSGVVFGRRSFTATPATFLRHARDLETSVLKTPCDVHGASLITLG